MRTKCVRDPNNEGGHFDGFMFCSLSAVDEQNGLHVGHQGHPAHPQSPSKSAIAPSSLPIPQICIPEPSNEPIPSTSNSGISFSLVYMYLQRRRFLYHLEIGSIRTYGVIYI